MIYLWISWFVFGPRKRQFRPLGSGAALHLQLPRHAMQGPWEPGALRTHHRMAAVLRHEALWIDSVKVETLWSLQFWLAQPGSKRGWSMHFSNLNYNIYITFTLPSLFGSNLGSWFQMFTSLKAQLSKVVWENRLKHRLGYKGEALQHPLRDLCSNAPAILHHWAGALWFVCVESASTFFTGGRAYCGCFY